MKTIVFALVLLLSSAALLNAQEIGQEYFTSPLASPYVPLESTLYRSADRLVASGITDSAILGQRPWTRIEFARLVDSASEIVQDPEYAWVRDDYERLRSEFAPELATVEHGESPEYLSIDDVYARYMGISGKPIDDSYHFGQTIYNDSGRPYWEGSNFIGGASATAVHGRWIAHLRGEYQHAPAKPDYPATLQDYLSNTVDLNVLRPSGHSQINRGSWQEAYVGVNFQKFFISVGKQEYWWGPAAASAMLYSDNAPSIYSGRIALRSPVVLPSFLRYLGPLRLDSFFGELPGHIQPSGPFTHGQKISFQPTHNLEFGFSRTVVFAGSGHPLTLGSFWRSFASVGDNPSAFPGSSHDVGDRRGGFDFTYRLPGVRQWAQLYGDFFTDDDPSPVAAPQRSAMNVGLYFSHLPHAPKLSLRMEGLSTPDAFFTGMSRGGRFFYFNGAYHEGYTADGHIIGSWIGRESNGYFATVNYEFNGDRNLELRYRDMKIDPSFLDGGGTISDGRVTYDFRLKSGVEVNAYVQYERWKMPLLDPGARSNVTTAIRLDLHPHLRFGH